MKRIMKKLCGVFRFIVGALVVVFGIRVCWTDNVPLLVQMAGVAVTLCGVYIVLDDSGK